MVESLPPAEIGREIYWVGYVDWNIRDFHSYETQRGASYNAYLVRDEKTALIDTVKAPYAENLLQNVAALTDLSRVDYVVCNHAEPDHSGALPRVMEALPGATLVCDNKCEAALAEHYDTSPWKIRLVAEGGTISLGRRTLQFIETPMVHWPESMFTYLDFCHFTTAENRLFYRLCQNSRRVFPRQLFRRVCKKCRHTYFPRVSQCRAVTESAKVELTFPRKSCCSRWTPSANTTPPQGGSTTRFPCAPSWRRPRPTTPTS